MARAKEKIRETIVHEVPETGEVIRVVERERSKYVRSNFYITHKDELFNLFDALGGQRYQVLKFIIDHMDHEHQLVMTTVEMAETIKEMAKNAQEMEQRGRELCISRKTISETLKLLESKGLIARKPGAIMLNPRLFNNKSASTEQRLTEKYEKFGLRPCEDQDK